LKQNALQYLHSRLMRGGWGIKIDTSYQNWYLTPLSPFGTTLTAPVRSILAVPSAKDYIAAVRPEYFLTFTTNERGARYQFWYLTPSHPSKKQRFANKQPKISDYYGVERMGTLIWFRLTNNPPSHSCECEVLFLPLPIYNPSRTALQALSGRR
jgi:hypothetical protein